MFCRVIFKTKEGDWVEVEYGGSGINIGDHEKNIYPNVLLVRAKLWHNDGVNKSPTLQSVHITLTTDDAMEMYARTNIYSPRTTAMLGANVWGRVYAPFDYDATVECNAEIIVGGEPTSEHFKIISLNQLQKYLDSLEIEKYSIALNRLVGEKKKKLEEFIKDLKVIQYDIENGTNA